MEVGLHLSQDYEGDEFEDDGEAVEQEIDGDEALKGESERKGPAEPACEDGDPGRAVAKLSGEDLGEEAVLGKGMRKPRVREGEIAEGAEVIQTSRRGRR